MNLLSGPARAEFRCYVTPRGRPRCRPNVASHALASVATTLHTGTPYPPDVKHQLQSREIERAFNTSADYCIRCYASRAPNGRKAASGWTIWKSSSFETITSAEARAYSQI